MRAALWFAAGCLATLAAFVAGYVALIRVALRQWDAIGGRAVLLPSASAGAAPRLGAQTR